MPHTWAVTGGLGVLPPRGRRVFRAPRGQREARAVCMHTILGPVLVAENRHRLIAPSWRLAQSGGSRDLLGVRISDTCQHCGPGQVSYPLCASLYHLQNRGKAAVGREKVRKDRPQGSLEATPGDFGARPARSGQTAASPGMHLPAQGLACPTCRWWWWLCRLFSTTLLFLAT